MSRLTLGGVELQRVGAYEVWFEFLEGGPSDSIYHVRGDDTVIPAKPGQLVRNRVPDVLPIVLVGWVEGQGATHTAKREDYVDLMAELLAVFDPALDPMVLKAWGPVEGLGSAVTATINARFLRRTGPAKVGEFHRRQTIYLESVDDPPVWVMGS